MNRIYFMMPSLCLLMACETQAVNQVKRSPLEQAIEASQNTIVASKAESLEESEDRDRFRFQVRHNPGRCDSPVFEAYLRGRWVRAFLNVDNAQLQTQLNQLSESNDLSLFYWVRGKLSTTTKLSPRRVLWPVVDVFTIEPPDTSKTTASKTTASPAPCT